MLTDMMVCHSWEAMIVRVRPGLCCVQQAGSSALPPAPSVWYLLQLRWVFSQWPWLQIRATCVQVSPRAPLNSLFERLCRTPLSECVRRAKNPPKFCMNREISIKGDKALDLGRGAPPVQTPARVAVCSAPAGRASAGVSSLNPPPADG